MEDCILDDGSGTPSLMEVEKERQELTIIRPGEEHYYGFRIRKYGVITDEVQGVFLIASEEPLDDGEAISLVRQFKPSPVHL